MKRKQVILLSIILFPSLLYFLFELTQANFKKMAYYGPKTISAKGDTIYYSVPDIKFSTAIKIVKDKTTRNGKEVDLYNDILDTFRIDTAKFPVYVILFLHSDLQKDGYKLEAFFDYAQYKPTEFKNVPIFFVSDYNDALGCSDNNSKVGTYYGLYDSLKIDLPSFHSLLVATDDAKKYFAGKPYYVFDYFAVLVDKHRHIRGYYDPNQNSEVKRLVQEYKHLKTKDEYANTLDQNNIGKK